MVCVLDVGGSDFSGWLKGTRILTVHFWQSLSTIYSKLCAVFTWSMCYVDCHEDEPHRAPALSNKKVSPEIPRESNRTQYHSSTQSFFPPTHAGQKDNVMLADSLVYHKTIIRFGHS